MALRTRRNPETGVLEVLVNGEWVRFDEYRRKQIDEAYQSSIRFLRERLGEDTAREVTQRSDEAKNN
jgi:hypothetical protein